MFKSLRQRLIGAALLILTGASISAPAQAGMPVIDAANLTQAIQEVLSWGQQLQGMVRQYDQLVSTYDSLTGPRGMQSLLPISPAQRNYLPANYSQLQS